MHIHVRCVYHCYVLATFSLLTLKALINKVSTFNPIETIVAFMRRAIAFLSGPWAHVCDENKGFIQTPVTFLS